MAESEEVLSLPYLQRLNIENLRYISNVEKNLLTTPAIFTGATVLAVIICLYLWKLHRNHVKARNSDSLRIAVDNFKKSGDSLHLSEGGVNTSAERQRQRPSATSHALATRNAIRPNGALGQHFKRQG
ncbi:hypothetical protein ACLKA7_001538 [Drosophila subpalustris]